jgi:integrase
MASITKQPNGRRTIQFVGVDGKRRSIRLGKVSQRAAEAVKVRVEHLVSAKAGGTALDPETARWLAGIADDLRDKLVAVGLVAKRASAPLGEFLDGFVEHRTDVKPATKVIWRNVKRNLKNYFGEQRVVRTIDTSDAHGFREYLVGLGLADATIFRRLNFTRQFFTVMRRRKLIEENPFETVRHTAGDATARQHFITQETTEKLIEAAPDWIWRTIIALCRFGGLRCPSEVLSVRWDGVDWERGRFRVDSPKTERSPGKAFRIVPMFPQLRPYLEEAWDMAEEGAVYVVPKYREAALGEHGWRNCNLRTQFTRILNRAAIQPWPRLFHNLRASRETELVEQFPEHIASGWIGNTVAVARRHYLQITEEAFQKAVQFPVQSAHSSGVQGSPKKQQNPAIPEKSEVCQVVKNTHMERRRVELPTSALRT